MFTNSFSAIRNFDWSHFTAALLQLGQFRAGLGRSVQAGDLTDHLRRDLGLAESGPLRIDPRDPRW